MIQNRNQSMANILTRHLRELSETLTLGRNADPGKRAGDIVITFI
jgi:hypothetical protein